MYVLLRKIYPKRNSFSHNKQKNGASANSLKLEKIWSKNMLLTNQNCKIINNNNNNNNIDIILLTTTTINNKNIKVISKTTKFNN